MDAHAHTEDFSILHYQYQLFQVEHLLHFSRRKVIYESSENCDIITEMHIQVLSEMEFNTWAPTQRNTVSTRGPQHEPLAKLVILCVHMGVCSVCACKYRH